MANRDGIVSHRDLFDKEPYDAAFFGDIEVFRILLQPFSERGQNIRKLERGGLVQGHGLQCLDFVADDLAPSFQGRHALSQFLKRHEPLLIGRQKALHAVPQAYFLLTQVLEAPLGRVRMSRRLLPSFQLLFDQGRLVQ